MSMMSDVEDDYRYSSGEEYSEQGEEELEVRSLRRKNAAVPSGLH